MGTILFSFKPRSLYQNLNSCSVGIFGFSTQRFSFFNIINIGVNNDRNNFEILTNKENQQSGKIWILHNYIYEDFRLASCMPVSWSSFPTGFHFCEGHNIPFFRYVSFLFYVFFPYIFLVSITPRLLPRSLPRSSPGHCPGHGVALASRIFDFFFLANSNVNAFLYFCHRVQEFLCDTTR